MMRSLLALTILIAIACGSEAIAQTSPPPAGTASSAEAKIPDSIDHGKGLKEVVDTSGQLSAWGLAVLGGSVATIVSASYIRPDNISLRIPYLLFIPGWGCALWSMYIGNGISRRYVAWLTGKPDKVGQVPALINEAFASQLSYLTASLTFFGMWLVAFLLIWIFSDQLQGKGK